MLRKLFSLIILCWSITILHAQRVKIPWPAVTDSSDLVDTRSRPIELQEKRTWDFQETGVILTNNFPGSRVNEAELENDSVIHITIRPENYPINMSPWYAFKVIDHTPGYTYFRITYEHGRHRYYPKTSRDGKNWQRLPEDDFLSSPKDTAAFFRVSTDKDTLWVSAQEQMTSSWTESWVRELSAYPYVTDTVFGESTQGRPMHGLLIGNRHARNVVVLLSRQHPPEVTGFKEMIAFVETLTSDLRLAQKFRKKYLVILAPMMNPDGVDNGHWRHNAGGIDLNRDWRWFNQPETYAFRQFVLNTLHQYGGTVRYGIDFHSTQRDLFYMPDDADVPTGKTLCHPWIKKINRKFREHPFSPESSGVTGQISKNWILHELHGEAITYEVGDETDREVIRHRGSVSAQLFMKMILRKKF